MISTHFPALQVITPLMAVPLAIILRRAAPVWLLAMTVTLATLAIALLLFEQVMSHGTITYAMGSWAVPYGIELRIDQLSAFMLLIVSGIGAVVMLYSRASIEHEIPQDQIHRFYAMYLLCLSGLLGIVVTGDVFNLFVFLEITSLSTYVMVSLGKKRMALTAAYRYLIQGTIGATFYLIGVGLMYMMTGTLNMADLAVRLPAVANTTTIMVAFAFVTVGISMKVALYPLHQWLPSAYTYAPSVVSAFLAATATKVAIYIFLRIFFTVFGPIYDLSTVPAGKIFIFFAVLGMFVGSIIAIFQTNIKRMLAYSSIAQVGYMILGISFASSLGVASAMVHLFNHSLMKCALFLVMGCLFLRLGSVRIKDLSGIGKRMPWTMAAFVVGGLSLIGVPGTVGFVSKWYLIEAALERGLWPLALMIPISSLLAVAYVWRVVEVAYFQPVPNDGLDVREAPLSMLIPVGILVLGIVYFGIQAEGTMGVALSTARMLMGEAP